MALDGQKIFFGYAYFIILEMMTGLDIQKSHILEVACLITNTDLEVISKDLNIVIHQSDEILANMNDWSMECHEATGLTNESRSSKITIQDAEQILLKYLKVHTEEMSPLAGNSVYLDRMFLCIHMPAVHNYLHHRVIDPSTIKQLITCWNLNVPAFKKEHHHRALSDIKESIQELKYYKKYLFNA
ncbi:putative oligoribonuclease isoform X2 [Ptiloglossa arizonensis]|uniref:putative oligoribonuclease isoform X2 n=1 Tax=Ptiloglossa arizonensis TaxID=3350558 RepID=UPI003FA15E7C